MRIVRALSVLVVCSAGCASFSSVPSLPDYRGPAHPVPLQLVVSERVMQQDGDKWNDQSGPTPLANSARGLIRKTGWLDEHPYDEGSARLDVIITNYQSDGPGYVAILSGLLLPGVIDNRIELAASLTAPNGASLDCVRQAQVRSWYQWLLIFAYPLRAPKDVRVRTADALALQCTAELLEKAGFAASP
ncbi:MAG TPA: hypothetical protein VMR31_03770 [Myxococcota bacterium]|nr:hypothetical protein [Myxococcota bacterium]